MVRFQPHVTQDRGFESFWSHTVLYHYRCRPIVQVVRPCQLSTASRNAGKENCFWVATIQSKILWSKWPSLWILPIREAAPTSIPQGAKLEPGPARFDPIKCMGTCTKHESRWKPQVTFIDDYIRHTWVCLIAKKSEGFACFLKVKSLAERETGRKIKCLRSDGGKEYFSNQFSS